MKKKDIQKLYDFLSAPKTTSQIATHLGIKTENLHNLLFGLDFKSLNLFSSRILSGENLYFLKSQIESFSKIEVPPRAWYYTAPILPEPGKIPYLRIQFLPSVDFKKITIVPISDLHYGHEGFNDDKFIEYVDWIKANKNVFCFLNGDIFENAHPDSPGGAIFDQRVRPKHQPPMFIEMVAPILDKILWAQPGNHEGRSIKKADIDPLFWFCQLFGIPYFDQPIYVDINWKEHDFSLFCQHGSTGALTEGGKFNMAARPTSWTDFTMFYVMGHVHDEITGSSIRRCRIVKQFKNGKVREYMLVDREQYIVVVPGWIEYWGTYAARKGYHPTSQGTVALHLRSSGSYEASS
ncbi:metallophosphoesterase [Patescibacteria group bacterium]|nr:metallophosphoesterase [Patescibacteria group bacterium]